MASLASPWGQAVSAGDPANTYFGSYREVFARDLYEAWTGLLADGDLDTARDATLFLFERQQLPDGSMPRNSLVNGKTAPDSFGTQLDEVAFPILMAQQLGLTDASLYNNHIKPAANFLTAHGPSFGSERWEEQGGFSPSTIAAEIAGLVAAADLARANGDASSAALWLGVADDWQRSIKGWTVTTNGPLAAHPYFIRLSKTGDPNAAITYNVGNGGPTLDQREVIDAGFLELVRLGELPATDPDVSSRCRSSTRRSGRRRRAGRAGTATTATATATAAATGGRGRRAARAPATSGPCSRPSAPSSRSRPATRPARRRCSQGMDDFASGVGLIPEQDWELPDLAASPFGTDPTLASIGFANGGAAGSASPLTWSAASFVRLAADLAAEAQRRPARRHPRALRRARAGRDDADGDEPRRRLVGRRLAGHGHRHDRRPATRSTSRRRTPTQNSATTVASTTAAADGSFSVDVAVTGGTSVLNVVAVSADRRHGAREAHDRLRLRAGDADLRRRRPGRRRQRPWQLRLSDVRQLQAGRLRHPGVPGLRRRRQRHLPAQDA